MTGFARVPAGLPVGSDGILRFKLLLVLVKDQGEWWITEYHNVAVTLNCEEQPSLKAARLTTCP
jgi:hypothetical protein